MDFQKISEARKQVKNSTTTVKGHKRSTQSGQSDVTTYQRKKTEKQVKREVASKLLKDKEYGVFQWNENEHYPTEKAIGTYKTFDGASRKAKQSESLVVRKLS